MRRSDRSVKSEQLEMLMKMALSNEAFSKPKSVRLVHPETFNIWSVWQILEMFSSRRLANVSCRDVMFSRKVFPCDVEDS